MKILLVDDYREVLDLLTEIVVETIHPRVPSARILTALNGEAAIKIIERHRDLNLIITDYHMPQADGFEVSSIARRLIPAVHIVMVSSMARDMNRGHPFNQSALASGVNYLFNKQTLNLKDFSAHLKKVLFSTPQ